MSSSTSLRPDQWQERRRIMTCVGHLVPRKQQEIARIVLMLRAYFVDHRMKSPKRGTLHKIMLVGTFARVASQPDRETGAINDYDIWAFVDHPEYRGRKRYWGRALDAITTDLQGRARVTLSVFTLDEIDRLRRVGNRFLTDQYDDGVLLYDCNAQPAAGGDDVGV